MLSCLFNAAMWSTAEKGQTSWPSCVWCFVMFCHFPMWCPGSGVVLDCIDSRSLRLYLLYLHSRSFHDHLFKILYLLNFCTLDKMALLSITTYAIVV